MKPIYKFEPYEHEEYKSESWEKWLLIIGISIVVVGGILAIVFNIPLIG